MLKKGEQSVGSILAILVLILIFIIAAFFVIYTFSPTSNTTTEQQSCQDLAIEAVSCVPFTSSTGSYAGVQVDVHRGPGAAYLGKLRFILASSTGTILQDSDKTLNELETVSVFFPATSQMPTAPSSVDVAGILTDGTLCSLSGPIICGEKDIVSNFAECEDTIDNDGDGYCDTAEGLCSDGSEPGDAECSATNDNTESGNLPQCADAIDNDGDGLIDLADLSCENEDDDSENSALPQCADAIDNDNDGLIDYPLDLECDSLKDDREMNVTQCDDGLDNDGDGWTDFDGNGNSARKDPSCADLNDGTEGDVTYVATQCSDGIDNEDVEDSLADGNDPQCATWDDVSETLEQVGEDECGKPSDDYYYLYHESDGLNVQVDPDGKSFTASLNGKDLRKKVANEAFFTLAGGNKPDVTYTITKACGGVDITYTVVNNKIGSVKLPSNFLVPGIVHTFSTQAEILYDNDYGGMVTMRNKDGSVNSSYLGIAYARDQMRWPGAYSPAIAVKDDSFSIGAAIMYPYLLYQHSVVKQLDKAADGTWTYKYQYLQYKNGTAAVLPEGEGRTYKVSLRFGKPAGDNWIFTLSPYKEFFNELYGPYRAQVGKDLVPIRGMQLSDTASPKCMVNDRFYCHFVVDPPYNLLSDPEGWNKTLDAFARQSSAKGFTRTMIWTPSGTYNNTGPGKCTLLDQFGEVYKDGCNFPTQFVEFTPKLRSTSHYFNELFTKYDIALGFWWGRSTAKPLDAQRNILPLNVWNPRYVQTINFVDNNDMAYMRRELDTALKLGTSVIGLDAFTEDYLKYYWIDEMHQTAKANYGRDLFLVGEASQADYVHSKIANYYSPCKHVFLNGPDILSYYLNPESEIWVQFGSNFDDENGKEIFTCPEGYSVGNPAEIKKYIKWGYTLVLKTFSPNDQFPDMSSWSSKDFKENECFDHEDNDGDGTIDWPFDANCTSFEDDSE